MDIRPLASAGICSFDPGFANTAGCTSAISWIDTEKSILPHRGYPVDQLARQCDFLEVAWILLRGDAPDEASYQDFKTRLPAIAWYMSRLPACAAAFVATRIRWP